MCRNWNCRFFVISTIVIAITRHFYMVNAIEPTEPPVQVVDAEEIIDTSASPSSVKTSTHVTVSSVSTEATTFSSYYSENSIDITTFALFEKMVLNSTKPIIVQFYGESSEPCKILTPRIGRAIDDKGGKIKLARVNIDDHKKIAKLAEVKTVPCIAAYRGGEIIEKLQGIKEESDLKIFVGKYIVD